MAQPMISQSTLLKQHFIDFYLSEDAEVVLPEELLDILRQPKYDEAIKIDTLVESGSDKLVMTLSSPHFTAQPQTYKVAGVSDDPDIYQQEVFSRTYESLDDVPTDVSDVVIRLMNAETSKPEFVILVTPEFIEDPEYAKFTLLNIFKTDCLVEFHTEGSTTIAGQSFDFDSDCVYDTVKQQLEINSPTIRGKMRVIVDTRLPEIEEADLGKLVPRRD